MRQRIEWTTESTGRTDAFVDENPASTAATEASGRDGRGAEAEEGEAFLELVEGFLLGQRTLGEAMGISREDVTVMASLGDQYLEAGHAEQAREIYEGCAVLYPAGSDLLARLAACADVQGRRDDRDVYLEALAQTWAEPDRARLDAFLQTFPDRRSVAEIVATAEA